MFSRRLNFPGKIIDKCIENLKSYRERFSADTALNFVSRILYLVAVSLQFIFFSKRTFYEDYSTSDSHTNTVILRLLDKAYYIFVLLLANVDVIPKQKQVSTV